jgi:membrane protein YqaA with SNARE-associated domain
VGCHRGSTVKSNFGVDLRRWTKKLRPILIVNFFAPAAHHQLVPHWAIRFGVPGLFLVSAIDASIVPLAVPGSTDLLLLWLVSHNGNPWLLASSAVAGSLAGGYLTWTLGKKSGEAALERWVPARILHRIVGWVKRHPILAVFLPPILPPPIPLAPFLLAAGALGVSRKAFLLAFGSARTVRYALVAWLAVRHGRHIIRLWAGTLEKWQMPLLCIFIAVIVIGLGMGIWKLRSPAGSGNRQAAAARAD